MNITTLDYFNQFTAGAPAKEELDSNSTTDEFIEAVAKFAATFILENRNAFDLDDAAAIKELADVLLVEDVTSRIAQLLVDEVASNKEKEEPVDKDAFSLSAASDSQSENEEFVSEDVMKILDE